MELPIYRIALDMAPALPGWAHLSFVVPPGGAALVLRAPLDRDWIIVREGRSELELHLAEPRAFYMTTLPQLVGLRLWSYRGAPDWHSSSAASPANNLAA